MANQWSISSICLRAAFTLIDPKSVNIQSRHQCLFALSGSVCAKAACKMLMKLKPDSVDRYFGGGLCDGEEELLLVHFRLLVASGSVLASSITGAKNGVRVVTRAN